MRGNFVDVPTDCPQRDERLGWTGDLQVFAPTATFLYDVGGFLADWLDDLRANQSPGARFPSSCPSEAFGEVPMGLPGRGLGRCGDRRALGAPRALRRHGAPRPPVRQHARLGRLRAGARPATGLLWPEEFQLGDWLDPERAARPAVAGADRRGPRRVRVLRATRPSSSPTRPRSSAHDDLAEEYGNLAATVRAGVPRHVRGSERPHQLRLPHRLRARHRLRPLRAARAARACRSAAGRWSSRPASYRIATGFVGTPAGVAGALGDGRHPYRLPAADRDGLPSWLYPVTMGATTVWERWDSMLPDGSINPGEMTSFNHYAFGSVADWMHQVDRRHRAGRRRATSALRFAPVPGRGRHVGASARSTRRTAGRVPLGHRGHAGLARRSRCRRTRRRRSCGQATKASRSRSPPGRTSGTTR